MMTTLQLLAEKPNVPTTTAWYLADLGELLTITTLVPKQFKTGSQGFYGQGQVVVDDKRGQLNFQMVEIGSQKKKQ